MTGSIFTRVAPPATARILARPPRPQPRKVHENPPPIIALRPNNARSLTNSMPRLSRPANPNWTI